MELSKAVKQGKTGKAIEAGDPEKIRIIAAHLRQKATAKKVNPKDLEKIDDELMAELAPVLRVALSGLVYAFYLRPDDLLVARTARDRSRSQRPPGRPRVAAPVRPARHPRSCAAPPR